MSIDQLPLMDENDKPVCVGLQDHIRKFNELGRIMVAMPDLYEAGKLGDYKLIQSLQTDFKKNKVISSTRIYYEDDSLEGTITQYFESTVVDPVETKVIIPHYDDTLLDDVLDTEQGLTFFQVLFYTNDTAEEIKATLQNLSGKTSKKSRVMTPSPENRSSSPHRAAGFCSRDEFCIRGNYGVISYSGRSRGVLKDPAVTAHEKRHSHKADNESTLPFDLDSGINKKARCVYFSDVQEVSDFTKYSGMFCFSGTRYVLSLTTPVNDNIDRWDKKLSALLAKKGMSSRDKLNMIHDEFSPMYACLQEYAQGDDEGFVLVDKVEGFDKPRVMGAGKQ